MRQPEIDPDDLRRIARRAPLDDPGSMGSSSRRPGLTWPGVFALALILAACSTDQGGHLFTAINQSDRDLVIQVDAVPPGAILLPAHTRSTLASGWSYIPEWTITVMDTSCAVLGALPVAGPGTVLTIAADGTLKTDADRSVFDKATEQWKTDPGKSSCPTSTPSPT